ncbi:MAG TPA: protein kinase [Vicinamibacterales bacterium]|nr:protein kinase [Vicinamibacterales bacterium]
MALQPGSRLGPYEIGNPLGAGGMGEVYQARDTRLDRTVAVKVMPAHLSSLPELKERFEREARTVSSLSHAHICALYDVGSQDGVDFLVMEYLQGETLAARLTSGALPLPQALEIASQIADALDKAHRQGVTHRDLKPGNIMLTKSGAKLLDFGLAKRAQNAISPASASIPASHSMLPTNVAAAPITAQGTILGTLQYMAPEQLEGHEADTRTDIFAFGTVVYEMLTGRRAFEGKSQVSLIAAIVDHEPPPVSSLVPVSPPLLDHLVKTCLAKNPDQRWQSMADVLLQLRLIASGGAATVVRRDVPASRLPWAVAAVAFMLFAAAGAMAAYLALTPEPAARRLQFDVATPSSGSPLHIAMSPLGTHLVANQNPGGRSSLWLYTIGHGTGITIGGTDGAFWPFWSRDGRTVGFFADGRLKKVDIQGTPPVDLAAAPNNAGGTWNADGVILFAPSITGPLYRVSASGGTATPLTTLDAGRGETSHRHPQFLSDGRRFLYVVVSTSTEQSGVYLASLDDPRGRRVTGTPLRAAFVAPDTLLFMSESTLMAQQLDPDRVELKGEPRAIAENVATNLGNGGAGFSVSDDGMLVYRPVDVLTDNLQLMWVTRDGQQSAAIEERGSYVDPALSPDGSMAVVSRDAPSGDLWTIDFARGAMTKFTFDAANDGAGLWSLDGARILFRSNRRSGVYDIYQKMVSGVVPETPVITSAEASFPEDVSPDGRYLVYRVFNRGTSNDLWLHPIAGGKPEPLVQSPANDVAGVVHPGGQWIAYQSNESGRPEIYLLSFPVPATRVQVSNNGGSRPRWSVDGRELYYTEGGTGVLTNLASTMMAVQVRLPASGPPQISRPQKLFDVPLRGGYDVARDGRFLMPLPLDGDAALLRPPSLRVLAGWTRTTP